MESDITPDWAQTASLRETFAGFLFAGCADSRHARGDRQVNFPIKLLERARYSSTTIMLKSYNRGSVRNFSSGISLRTFVLWRILNGACARTETHEVWSVVCVAPKAFTGISSETRTGAASSAGTGVAPPPPRKIWCYNIRYKAIVLAFTCVSFGASSPRASAHGWG